MENSKKGSIKGIVFSLIGIIIFALTSFIILKNTTLRQSLEVDSILTQIKNIVPKITLIILLFLIFKLTYHFFISVMSSRLRKIFVSKFRFNSIKKFIHFCWWAIFIIIAISVLVNDLTTLVTSVGLIGLGLTFALQKPILNFVGWITIILKDIYNEGDRIKVGGIRGDVKEIHLMNTVLYSLLEDSDTRSQKIVTIPNEQVLTVDVENYTKDSNYILNELKISITYESDYNKAIRLLDEIVTKNIKENFKKYLKWRQGSTVNIESFLKNVLRRDRGSKSEEIEELKDLQDEFKPKVRLEMADSSIILIAQFLTPYDEIKKTRTKINLEFLNTIKKHKNIEVAYPHMEVVYKNKKK